MTEPVVIVTMEPGDLDDFITPAFAARDDWSFSIQFVNSEDGIDALIKALNTVQTPVMITGWNVTNLPPDFLMRVPHLKYIASAGGSVRWMLPRAFIEQGLIVTNWGESIGRIVAEHCLLQILGCLRQVAYHQLNMHIRGGWDDRAWNSVTPTGPRSLFERRIGIHGFGYIAQALVRLLAPFECAVAAYAPGDPDEKFAAAGVRRCASLEELFSTNEIVVELAPLIPETRGIVTADLLNRLPSGGVFVNSGRGAVVDAAGLLAVARAGRITLALDVYSDEPLAAESPLRGLSNVLLTPHIAGPTADRRRDCGRYALENVQAYFDGRPLRGVIDLWQFDHMT